MSNGSIDITVNGQTDTVEIGIPGPQGPQPPLGTSTPVPDTPAGSAGVATSASADDHSHPQTAGDIYTLRVFTA